jgi:hypothetical protein
MIELRELVQQELERNPLVEEVIDHPPVAGAGPEAPSPDSSGVFLD